jgi:hypothetical protein
MFTEEPRRQLKSIVAALNGEDVKLKVEGHAQLVRFVTAWNEAKRNPWKMKLPAEDAKRFSIPNLEKVWRLHLAPIGRTPETERLVHDLERAGKHVRDDVGGAYWSISPTGENFRDQAALYASMLLTNPLRGNLCDAPCLRTQCGRWFIKRRALQKQCSGRCTGIVQNTDRKAVLRGEKHGEELRRALKASQRWKPGSGVEWKKFVSDETGLTFKWLTRAVNQGELQQPNEAPQTGIVETAQPWRQRKTRKARAPGKKGRFQGVRSRG